MPESAEYHATHLAFARTEIVQAAADGRPILGLLRAYTDDVKRAERERIEERLLARAAATVDPNLRREREKGVEFLRGWPVEGVRSDA